MKRAKYNRRDSRYLRRLRETYRLDDVIAGTSDSLECLRHLTAWVHTRWRHDGKQAFGCRDPIGILEAAAAGKSFRCVEYAVVLAAALISVGVPGRVLCLMTRDVETRRINAGHVVAEAYLEDRARWGMADPQFDVVPSREGAPLSANELRLSLRTKSTDVCFGSSSKADDYRRFVEPYLYYFSIALDQRYGVEREPGSLVLGPPGASEPRVFQRTQQLTRQVYTHSKKLFYAPIRLS